MNLTIYAVIQGIVQGITELLPISSTAHLIIVDKLIAFQTNGRFVHMFEVVIQLGSILAFLVYFHKKLFPAEAFRNKEAFRKMFSLWLKSAVGVIPACIVGLIAGHYIQDKLYGIPTISCTLIIGGILLFFLDHPHTEKPVDDISKLSYLQALEVGAFQCVAMIPGVSRSAATIIGGLICGGTRVVAVEYSFFLAIPTMVAASGYSLLKHGAVLTAAEWGTVAVGFIVSFFVSWGVVIFFMNYIKTRNFRVFAVYRILLGLVLIGLLLKGIVK